MSDFSWRAATAFDDTLIELTLSFSRFLKKETSFYIKRSKGIIEFYDNYLFASVKYTNFLNQDRNNITKLISETYNIMQHYVEIGNSLFTYKLFPFTVIT